jgi:epoxyqueuosine reductase
VLIADPATNRMTNLSTIWPAIDRAARAGGALHVGASDLTDTHAQLFEQWIGDGHHATMRYLAKNRAIRLHPETRFSWARSVIVILVPYASARPDAPDGALSNHIARYALGDDYHEVLDRMLRDLEGVVAALAPGAKTWRYVDTGPLSDRALAAQAGLGWIAKNSMLINEEHGSYFFIGTLLTSLDNDITAGLTADRCGTCTRCIDACPTQAILPNRTVASELCISYATIEHRGPLEASIASRLEGNAFGCDICQEVCPWNDGRVPQPHPAFEPRNEYRATPVTDLLRFSQADFSSFFRKSAVKRARLDGMQRNVETIATKR